MCITGSNPAAVAALQALTPLQCTRLFLGFSGNPYLMDCMQLCHLVETQWQQQWGNCASAADKGHLLAASAAEGVPLLVRE